MAEPAIRAHHATRGIRNSLSPHNRDALEQHTASRKFEQRTTAPVGVSHDHLGKTSRSVRSEYSALSDESPIRNSLVLKNKKEKEGEWDQIVQYNQREGRRIASMAAAEVHTKKMENKMFLDQQVMEHEKRRKKEERAKMEFIREQKQRLRRLEEEEARKEAARDERILRIKAEQDDAAALVRERKQKELEKQRRDDMQMLRRIEIENQKAREKEQAKFEEAQARSKELKAEREVQLNLKAKQKRFEAEEEKQLQIAAKRKAEDDERKRLQVLQDLQDKMTSKQKIGESLAADMAVLAKKDEDRALREQAAYDAKKRKEEADKIRAQQMRQREVLDSLEEQLALKKSKADEEKRQRQKDAVTLSADAEKAYGEAINAMEAQAQKRQDYYHTLTEHIEQKHKREETGSLMTDAERQINAKVLSRMQKGK